MVAARAIAVLPGAGDLAGAIAISPLLITRHEVRRRRDGAAGMVRWFTMPLKAR